MAPTYERLGRYVDVQGSPAYYETCGSGQVVLCIHSAGTSSMLYRHTLPSLAAHGFQVVAVDLPGHGKSIPLEWKPVDDLHQYAEWIMEFSAKIGLERPVVIGTSIGGNIVLDLAVHHSDELTAVAAFEGAAYTPTFPGAGTLQEPHTVSWESNADAVAPAAVRPDATPEQLKEISWLHTAGSQRFYANDLIGWDKQDLRARLGEIDVPVLLAVGAGDWFLPEQYVSETAQGIRGATYVKLDRLGHWPPWEDPETVNALLIEFLDKHGLRSAPASSGS